MAGHAREERRMDSRRVSDHVSTRCPRLCHRLARRADLGPLRAVFTLSHQRPGVGSRQHEDDVWERAGGRRRVGGNGTTGREDWREALK